MAHIQAISIRWWVVWLAVGTASLIAGAVASEAQFDRAKIELEIQKLHSEIANAQSISNETPQTREAAKKRPANLDLGIERHPIIETDGSVGKGSFSSFRKAQNSDPKTLEILSDLPSLHDINLQHKNQTISGSKPKKDSKNKKNKQKIKKSISEVTGNSTLPNLNGTNITAQTHINKKKILKVENQVNTTIAANGTNVTTTEKKKNKKSVKKNIGKSTTGIHTIHQNATNNNTQKNGKKIRSQKSVKRSTTNSTNLTNLQNDTQKKSGSKNAKKKKSKTEKIFKNTTEISPNNSTKSNLLQPKNKIKNKSQNSWRNSTNSQTKNAPSTIQKQITSDQNKSQKSHANNTQKINNLKSSSKNHTQNNTVHPINSTQSLQQPLTLPPSKMKAKAIASAQPNSTFSANETSSFADEIPGQIITKTTYLVKLLAFVGLAVFVIGAIALLLFLAYKTYVQEIRSAIMNGYTEFIEKQLPQRKLTAEQIARFEGIKWTEKDLQAYTAAVGESRVGNADNIISVEISHEGRKFFIQNISFGQNNLSPVGFVIDPAVTAEKVFYYEIEVFQKHDQAQFVIGYATPEALAQNQGKVVGRYEGSVSLDILNGHVRIDDELLHTFDWAQIISEYHNINESGMLDISSNFYGIGINFHTKLFFFTFNGVIVHGASFQAQTNLRYKIYDMRKRDLLSNEEGIRSTNKLSTLVKKVLVDKKYRDQIKTMKEFPCRMKTAVPVISLENLSKFEVNIGAFPFQLRDRELKHGLLWTKA